MSAQVRQAMSDLPYFSQIRPEPGRRAAWVLAVLMHVLLAAFLIYGISWQTSAPEQTVSVDLVRYAPATAERKSPAPPPPKPAPQPPAPIPPKVEVEEPPAPPKAQILRKAPEQKPKPQKVETPRNQDSIDKALEKATRQATQVRLDDALARAESQLKASQAAAARNKGLVDYLAKIRGKVRGNIVLPPNIDGNPESIFEVTQLPGGEVLKVVLKKSSGIPALDAAVERALYKSSPLPKPDDPSLFARDLSIKYRPLED